MGEARSSETSANIYQTTRSHIPGGSILQTERRENPKSHKRFQIRKKWNYLENTNICSDGLHECSCAALRQALEAIPRRAELSCASRNISARTSITDVNEQLRMELVRRDSFPLVFVGREGRLRDDCQGSKVELFIKNDFLVYLLNCPYIHNCIPKQSKCIVSEVTCQVNLDQELKYEFRAW